MYSIQKFLSANGGYAHMSELRAASFQTRDIRKWVHNGTLEKIKPGFYRLSEFSLDGPAHFQIIDMCMAYPKAILCLVSALDLYELTTTIPSHIHLAIPQNERAPKITYPRLWIHYFSKSVYELGVTTKKYKTGAIRIYSPEKTICDMFRYRKKLGEDIAMESLKRYMQDKKPDINKMLYYAKICRVMGIMEPYLHALVS